MEVLYDRPTSSAENRILSRSLAALQPWGRHYVDASKTSIAQRSEIL
jgi:hypothetical protein